jgi:hypothetical protein
VIIVKRILALVAALCMLLVFMPSANAAGEQFEIAEIKYSRISQEGQPLELAFDVLLNRTPEPKEKVYIQLWGEDATGWNLIKPFDAYPVAKWRPTTTTDDRYRVQARIKRTLTGKVVDQETVLFQVESTEFKVSDITANPAEPVRGKLVTLSAEATTFSNVKYHFEVSNAAGFYKDFGTLETNTVNWTPNAKGLFNVKVTATNKDNVEAVREEEINVLDRNYVFPEISDVSITTDPDGKVNVVAQNVARDGVDLFGFSIGESMRDGQTKRDFAESNQFEWLATKPGIYEVRTLIKDENSIETEDKLIKKLVVARKDGKTVSIQNVVLSHPELIQNRNTIITFNVEATGGDNLEYSFWRLEDKGYRLIKDYSNDPIFTWVPANPGVYDIVCRVKDKTSGAFEDQKSFTYTIEDPSTSEIVLPMPTLTGTKKKGFTQTIKANATGSNNLLYQFWVDDGRAGARILQPFSPNNVLKFVPKYARNYKVTVWVKDAFSGSYEEQQVVQLDIQE